MGSTPDTASGSIFLAMMRPPIEMRMTPTMSMTPVYSMRNKILCRSIRLMDSYGMNWTADDYAIGMDCEYCAMHTTVVTPFNAYMLCPTCYALHIMSATVRVQNEQMHLPNLAYLAYENEVYHSYSDLIGNAVVVNLTLDASTSALQDVLNRSLHERAPPETIDAEELALHVRESTREQFTCEVCTEDLTGARVMTMRCGHETCSTCMHRWALEHGNTCPFCRELIVDRESDVSMVDAEEGVQ